MAYGPIVLAGLLLDYVLFSAGDVLNLRALRREPPDEFRNLYDSERYAQSQAYTREATRLAWVVRTVDLTLVLAFWTVGGFEWLDVAVRGLGAGPIATGTLYVAALVLAQEAVAIPSRWYSTFVIEERFGFNRTTHRTFVLDALKGLLLAAALGAPLLAAFLWFLDRTGDAAWLWCAGVASAFLVVVQFVAPAWILPLFHTFQRLDAGELERALRAYAARIGFPIDGVFVIDGSRRSTRANAFLTGFGSRKRIALFDTLLQQHSIVEVVAVVAHEIGHFKRRHILKELALTIAQVVLAFYLLSLLLRDGRLFEAFHVSQPSTYVGLVLFAIAYTPIGLAWSLAVQAYARANEYEADAFARATTGDGEALAGALEKLSAQSLTNLTPHPLFVALHFEHPPLADRVAALRPGSAAAH